MPIESSCPECGHELPALSETPDRGLHCPKCGAALGEPGQPRQAEQGGPAEAGNASKHPPFMTPVSKHPEDLVDMTAMVDIVFFLLIFFLVTSMQSVESVIDLPSPQASSASSPAQATNYTSDPTFVTVSIEDDDSVWLNDEQIYGEQDLRSKLRQIRREDDQVTGMMVLGSPQASHGVFVMVLDAAADAELTELRFSVPDENDDAVAMR